MLSCVVSCTEHFFCKLRHDLLSVLLNEFLGKCVHKLWGRFQLFHHGIRIRNGAVFLALEATLHRAHIRIGIKSRLKFLCIDFPVFTQNMCIDFRNHIDLRMSRVSLGSFQISLVQLQLTRAKKRVVLAGEKSVLFMAIHKNEISKRNTLLGERICLYYRAYAKSAGLAMPEFPEEKLKAAG